MRRRVTAAAAALALLSAAGCWDHVPVENAAFVVALGFDPNPREPYDAILTQVVARPAAFPGSSGEGGGQGGGEQKSDYLVSSHAAALQGAFSKAQRHMPRVSELDHIRGFVLGEDYARLGAEDAIGWGLRHPQVRGFVDVIVSRGPAQNLLDSMPALEPLPGNTLLGILKEVEPTGLAFRTTLLEFTRAALSPRRDPIVPFIELWNPLEVRSESVFEQRPVTDPGGAPESAGGGASPSGGAGADDDAGRSRDELRIAGLAVFKDNRMIGTLEGTAARGAALIKGGSLGAVSVAHPGRPGRYVSVSFTRVSSKVRPEMRGDDLVISIEVSASGEVLETGILEPGAAGRWLKSITEAVESSMAGEIRAAMDRLQTVYGADPFAVAEQLYRSSPEAWRSIEPRWEEVYARARVEPEVKVVLKRLGLSR